MYDLGGYSKVVADKAEEQAKSTSKTAKELAKILKYTRDLSVLPLVLTNSISLVNRAVRHLISVICLKQRTPQSVY